VKFRLAIGICLLLVSVAHAQSAAPQSRAGQASFAAWAKGHQHPSVARIVAQGDGSVSYGSGTLIYTDEHQGLVITNWHVINEATGQISVHFPDGFYSLGALQSVDRDWDLAVIAIRKPNAAPVSLSSEAPHPGEVLTIAGYGSGQYRAVSGYCTQYVAPGMKFPFEMVEVAVSARQGDSGGPIFNERGELAGVLFGEGNGRTSGSYCGRVKWFLSSIVPSGPPAGSSSPAAIPGYPSGPAMQLAATPPLSPVSARPTGSPLGAAQQGANGAALQASPQPTGGLAANGQATSSPFTQPGAAQPVMQQVSQAVSRTSFPQAGSQAGDARWQQARADDKTVVLASTRGSEGIDPNVHVIGWTDIAGDTFGEQFKTVLAGFAVFLMLLKGLRYLNHGDESAKAK